MEYQRVQLNPNLPCLVQIAMNVMERALTTLTPTPTNQFSGKPTKFCLILYTLAVVNMNCYPQLEDPRLMHVNWIVLKILSGRFCARRKSNCTGWKRKTWNTGHRYSVAFHLWCKNNMPTGKKNPHYLHYLHLQCEAIRCQKWMPFPCTLGYVIITLTVKAVLKYYLFNHV